MKEIMKWFANEEEGQGMVEYALILALIAVACIGVLSALRGGIEGIFNKANTELGTAIGGGNGGNGGNAGNAG